MTTKWIASVGGNSGTQQPKKVIDEVEIEVTLNGAHHWLDSWHADLNNTKIMPVQIIAAELRARFDRLLARMFDGVVPECPAGHADILDDMGDLYVQATTERSHYAGKVIKVAMETIVALRQELHAVRGAATNVDGEMVSAEELAELRDKAWRYDECSK